MTYPTNPENRGMQDNPIYQNWYMWLGAEADDAQAELETYEQLVRELPGLDAENDD